MANSDLKGKYFQCPDKVLKKIEKEASSYKGDSTDSGFKRAKNILKNNGKISYEQMKRIKNYFDEYDGDKTDEAYKLNGGDEMKKWVEEELDNARDAIYNQKKVRMDAGEENTFKKTHSKDKSENPSKVRIPKIHKSSKMRNVMQNKANYESEIKKKEIINELIEYLSKKNNIL